MSDISINKLRRLDVSALLVFVALMQHRKATTVADAFGVTQSSVSHTLRRLREVFDDPLFLRRPHGLEPTAVAVALQPQVSAVLELLGRAVSAPMAFDPGTSEETLRVAASDFELATLFPDLVARMAERAPRMRVLATPARRAAALRDLDERRIDLALGYFSSLGTNYVVEPLFEESFRVVARRGHPAIADGLTLARYLAADHLVVSPGGELRGVVDDALEERGKARRVTVALPLFLPALAAVAHSNLVATLPSRLVDRFSEAFGLVSLALPVSVRGFTVSVVRHRRDADNALHDWVVGELKDVL